MDMSCDRNSGVRKLLRIIVTFAVRAEFSPWRRLRRFKRVNGNSIYLSQSGGDDIYAVVTGIGTRGTREELRKLFDRPVDICVVSGLAGRLKRKNPAGKKLRGGAGKSGKKET